jgi:hypothetical protein
VICGILWQKGNKYRVLVGKPKERPLGGGRLIWEGNVKMNLQELEEQGMKWIMCLRIRTVGCSYEPSASITCWEFLQ